MDPVYVHENPGPFPAIKKSLRKKRDVYFRIFGAKVLKFDRPLAGGFLSLTALQAEGCGIALRAMSMYGCSAALVGAL